MFPDSVRSPPAPLLGATEVAALLEIDLTTLARWEQDDRLNSALLADGRPGYPTADVLQLMVDINREQKAASLPAQRSPGSAGAQHDHKVAVAEADFETNRTAAQVATARSLVAEAAARAAHERSIAAREAAKLVADAAARDAAATRLRVAEAAVRVHEAAQKAAADDRALACSDLPEMLERGAQISFIVQATAAELAKESAALASLVAQEVAATAERLADTKLTAERTIAAEVAATAAAVALRALATSHIVADEVAARLALDETKTQLFASVIHELRTPMTSITAFTALLQEDDATPQQQQRLSAIERNADRVTTLVDDLLHLSSLEQATEVAHTAVDMCAVVTATQSAWEMAGADHVDVSFAVPSTAVLVNGEARSLESLVANLVSNAVKFTGDGGWVRCTLKQEDEWVHLQVSDNGIGIPEAEQQLLFSRFFRSSTSRENAIPGTGLGLAIVESILKRHGGKISVASSDQRGTIIDVELPAFPAEAELSP